MTFRFQIQFTFGTYQFMFCASLCFSDQNLLPHNRKNQNLTEQKPVPFNNSPDKRNENESVAEILDSDKPERQVLGSISAVETVDEDKVQNNSQINYHSSSLEYLGYFRNYLGYFNGN